MTHPNQPANGAMMQLTDEQIMSALSIARQHVPNGTEDTNRVDAAMRALLSASKPAAPQVDTASFVQPVPDHCDRIVWRGAYYGLPPAAPAQSVEPVAYTYQTYSGQNGWLEVSKQEYDESEGKYQRQRIPVAAPQQPAQAGLSDERREILEWCAKYHARRVCEGDYHYRITTTINALLAEQPAPAVVAQDAQAGDAITKEWCMNMAALEPDEGVPPAGLAAVAQDAQSGETCQTCNGRGMIGGPSYYAPDEGGEPCPNCVPAAVAQDEQDGQAEFEAYYESKGRPCYGNLRAAMWMTWQDARAASPQATALSYLKQLEPFLDSLICYASTCSEYPTNQLVVDIRKFLGKKT